MKNKLERLLKTKFKWIRRLKILRLYNKGSFIKQAYSYKEQSKPYSCFMCSSNKYSRKNKHKKNILHENIEFHNDFLNDIHK